VSHGDAPSNAPMMSVIRSTIDGGVGELLMTLPL
jgi:hypothetical protein